MAVCPHKGLDLPTIHSELIISKMVYWGDCKSNKSNQIKCWFLRRGENRSSRRKTSRSRVENQQTQPTYDAGSGNRTRDTLVEGERSHHYTNPAPPKHRLLNTDYKIATKAIAARIAKVLPNLIHEYQNYYIKGRFIGQNVRLVADINECMDTLDISGTALLLDFRKGFGSLK